MKTLIAGCFSNSEGNATAGDLLAAELVCNWLEEFGCPYDIAVYPPFHGGISKHLVDPQNYTHLIYVCGPFGNRVGEADFLEQFAHCCTIGINLTMLEPLDEWNPFDILLERNSSARTQPDITFLSSQKLVPVVGVCLVEPYGAPFEKIGCGAIEKFIASKHISVIQIDTRLDHNRTGLRSSAEIESVLARMDVVITTRLHGTVLSLKNGVPTISIDLGGDSLKIKRQAEKIGWPIVFTGDEINEQKLQQAFDYCLTQEARLKAKSCADFAKIMAEEIRNEFITSLTHLKPQTYNKIDNLSSKEKFIKPTNKNSTDRIFTDIPLDITWFDSKVPDKSLMRELRQRLKSILFPT